MPASIRPALVLCALLLASASVQAQAPLVDLEIGAEFEHVSDGFPNTRGVWSRATFWQAGGTWRAEWGSQERFGESGMLVGLGHTRGLSRRWVGSVYLGGSTEGRYHARVRAGAEVAYKAGSREQIVTTVGAWFHDARTVHRDYSGRAEVAYYSGPWLLQAGARYTVSTPGDARGYRAEAAVTLQPSERHSLALAASAGREAYQLVEPFTAEVEFPSWEASLTWKAPLTERWGTVVRANAYRNPYYIRAGVSAGLSLRL